MCSVAKGHTTVDELIASAYVKRFLRSLGNGGFQIMILELSEKKQAG